MKRTFTYSLAAGAMLLAALTGCNPDNGGTGTTTTNSTTTMSSGAPPPPPAMTSNSAAPMMASSSDASGSPDANASAGAMQPASSSSVAIDAANGTSVTIGVTDAAITMPKDLPAASVGFKVTNTGKNKHNLEIKGGDVDKKLDAPLDPGASSIVQVDLKPGKYEVTDPDNPTLKAELEVK